MNDSPNGEQPDLNADPKPNETDSDMAALLIAFFTIFVTLALLACWPDVKQYIPGLADPARVQFLGPVQRIRYVGGFSTHTQVEAGAAVMLLAGAVEVERGVAVERRQSEVADRLCVVGTPRCHEIVSH